jgi:hypothetical protein
MCKVNKVIKRYPSKHTSFDSKSTYQKILDSFARAKSTVRMHIKLVPPTATIQRRKELAETAPTALSSLRIRVLPAVPDVVGTADLMLVTSTSPTDVSAMIGVFSESTTVIVTAPGDTGRFTVRPNCENASVFAARTRSALTFRSVQQVSAG